MQTYSMGNIPFIFIILAILGVLILVTAAVAAVIIIVLLVLKKKKKQQAGCRSGNHTSADHRY